MRCLKITSAVLIVVGIALLGLQLLDSSVSDSWTHSLRRAGLVSQQPPSASSDRHGVTTGGITFSTNIWKTLFNKVGGSCQPKRNIFFLKTHKTASSTLINILFRYGEIHDLTFALPVRLTYYYYPDSFLASYVDHYSERGEKTFNIMCHHMRFKLPEVQKVMPKDTFYFTIMRNPISLMESSFSYYKFLLPFTRAKNLEDFLNHNSKYYNAKMNDSYVAKNFMTFDLGFDPNGLDTIENVKRTLGEVEKIFDLVLITEYFDESLILLKDALCWSFDDILSIPLNKRSKIFKKSLTLETQEKVKQWNSLDWQLYVYFNNSFWKRVEMFGRERMQHEVNILQKKREENKKECLLGEVAPRLLTNKLMMPHQSGIDSILGYNLKPVIAATNKLLCQRLVTPEIQYTNLLRYKQIRKRNKARL